MLDAPSQRPFERLAGSRSGASARFSSSRRRCRPSADVPLTLPSSGTTSPPPSSPQRHSSFPLTLAPHHPLLAYCILPARSMALARTFACRARALQAADGNVPVRRCGGPSADSLVAHSRLSPDFCCAVWCCAFSSRREPIKRVVGRPAAVEGPGRCKSAVPFEDEPAFLHRHSRRVSSRARPTAAAAPTRPQPPSSAQPPTPCPAPHSPTTCRTARPPPCAGASVRAALPLSVRPLARSSPRSPASFPRRRAHEADQTVPLSLARQPTCRPTPALQKARRRPPLLPTKTPRTTTVRTRTRCS